MSTDQRPFARFRLPWLSAAITRPVAEPQPVRPPVEIIQAPTQPTTTVPAQRPPFQPAGITPTQSPPPQPQAPQITEPQPSLPPRAIIESRLPASPSRAKTQPQAAAVPPSPSQVTLQSVSPSRVASQPRVASVPLSPTRTSSQPQPTVQTVWQQFLLASQLTSQTSVGYAPYNATSPFSPIDVESTHPRPHCSITYLSGSLAETTKPSAKPESMETHKGDFTVTSAAQKIIYEPTVKRRCLRELFSEPSDSDPDNPEKPRRHGCRYNCAEKSKDK